MTQSADPKTGPAAIVLAAGLSKRMGRPKMVLPWGQTTVIGQVVDSLLSAGVSPIRVVTGGAREEIEQALQGRPVELLFNPDYANGEMQVSLQLGLNSLPREIEAALVVLGDQPRMRVDTVHQVLAAAADHPGKLVVPSYQMRRGHPWLVPARFWDEILALRLPQTLRDFMRRNAEEIAYVNVDTDSILQDLDTPEDYERAIRELGG